ncbi:hypothetical protein KVR01_003571 [Diaporthe batatas]|uniref:uncharacterized protein n=1 Tax=Diaporthe batatas TaxID=748121 RepID=UPI001D044AC9|nr:uncharacterized protein KVR01_003571 [Diaporthe batatas]KAG8167882.1 hypothetical protein KVR01_003571 [Diaporthe batatas]
MTTEQDPVDALAIIGLSVKFPQDATTPDAFWEMLREGRSAASRVPADRFNVDAFYHPDPNRLDSFRVRDAHFMAEDPRAFDASFFNMSAAEASVLDPQQRGLLESSYHCFENAGITLPSLVGSKTAVFVACFGKDYDAFIARDIEAMSRYHATGSGSSMLANRISHAYDLRGPSITVDTACSAGLSAFHLACQSVLHGESEMSLVAAGNTYLTPESLTIPLDDAGFLSPDGRCYSFDFKANGYARGEGFGAVLVKPLRTALRDGNVIRAVIRATGVNQDGRTPSITQPSSEAQIKLIKDTYVAAGLDLATTQYVEAHGTGTPTGDPIEAASIGMAFSKDRDGDKPLYVGSVKSNIGHLEGASGLAGIIKTVLALEKAVIPPICNFEKANPAIDQEKLRIAFPAKALPWPSPGLRRASVSSFGYGGSNGHVILDDAYNYLRLHGLDGLHKSVDLSQNGSTHGSIQQLNELDEVPIQKRPSSTISSTGTPDDSYDSTRASSPLTTEVISSSASSLSGYEQDAYKTTIKGILPLSAADEDGPTRVASTLSEYLKTDIGRTHDLKNVLHTLSGNRTHHPWRTFGVVDQSGVLDLVVGETLAPAVRAGHIAPLLHFIFTGQGAQWARMGFKLLHFEPFSHSLQKADAYLRQELGCEWSLMRQLELTADTGSKIGQPALAQPLTTALQVALVDLMKSWDVVPSSVTGHSSGEIAAAYCAGALSREEAWAIAYFRGVVTEKLASNTQRPKSGMMSVGLGAEKAQAYLEQEGVADRVSVACINSPFNVTISGQTDALDMVYQSLEKDELFVRRLAVQVAYHNSNVMSEVSDEYGRILSKTLVGNLPDVQDSSISFFSSVIAGRLTDMKELRTPSYWVRNLVSPVHFSDAIGSAVQESSGVKTARNNSHFFVEIGPQAALRRPTQDTMKALSKEKFQYINTLDAKKNDVSCLLGALGQLWCAGVNIDLVRVNRSCFDTLEGKDAPAEPTVIVDLPSYPFSRARLDWAESRLSKGFAFRPHRRHALLGLAARDWNPNEASWRHLIRYAENPWIMDHTVNGSSVYPGAGIIVMAIEAARQMTETQQQYQSKGKQQRIVGYRVADVRFLRSISVDTSERGNEAQLHMRQRRDNINNTLQKWYDWRVFTIGAADEWLEAAHGSIKVEVETIAPGDETTYRRQQREFDRLRMEHKRILDACKYKTYPDQMYGNIRAHGMDYGPYFARLSDISYSNDGRATASVTTRDYAEKMEYANEDPCVIHPTTLDALCHLQMVSVSAGGLRSIPAMMFTHCREMWISNKLFEMPGNLKLQAATTETMRGFRECECDTVALHAETGEPMVIIRGERGTAITSLDHDHDAEPVAACYQLAYRPDLSLMANDEAFDFLMNNTFKDFALPDKNCLDRVDAIVNYYVKRTLQLLEKEGFTSPTDHRTQYIQWMKRQYAKKSHQDFDDRSDIDVEALLLADPAEPTEGLVRRVGENLHNILTGKANALQILFEGTLMQEYYSAEVFQIHCDRVGAYVELLAHANPYLRILEVGAGTGSSAAGVLPYLTYYQGDGKKTPRIAEYMYTDISPGFFEKAQERFADYANVMKYKKLDLEEDPIPQGFEEGSYDIVIAGNVLHATSDLAQSLRSVRRLLKPGGKFVMVEITNPQSARENFIFGLLSGWWLRALSGSSEWVFPNQGPLLTDSQWNDALKEAGFSGTDLQLKDHDKLPYHRLSTLVATAVAVDSKVEEPPQRTTYIVKRDGSELQTKLAESIKNQVTDHTVTVTNLESIREFDLTGANTIALLEANDSILHDPDEDQMSAIKHCAMGSRRMVWVTSGGGPQARRPEADISLGWARTVCTERGDQGVIVVSLESPENTSHSSGLITSVLRATEDDDQSWSESELAEVGGVLQVPRVAPNGRLNDVITSRTHIPKKQTCSIGPEVEKHVSLSIKNPGLLDTLYFKEVAGAGAPLGDGEVEIQVMASSMNFKDVMIALGQIPSHGFGYDGAGIINRTGPNCKYTKPGDRVMFVSMTGAFSTFVHVSELLTQAMLDGMSFTVAASIPVIYSTVIFSLDYIARIRPGESVLIHSAAGGVGQAAIMVAKKRGIKDIYVTASSDTKRELLVGMGIPDDNIFYSRDTSFVDDIMHATGGRGVDVVLNSLGGELLQQSWKCIKTFGRFVEIGKADILQKTGLTMEPFERNATFSAVDMYVVVENAQETMKQVMTDVMDLWSKYPEEVHEPRPLHVYPAAKFEDAMRYLQSGKNIGKTVIDWSQPSEVTYRPMLQPAYKFRADASYVLAGGLGGLSREIVNWMISRGARNFICLSRSGVEGNKEGLKFIEEVEKSGATIFAPACNIADRDALERTLRDCADKLPPIRGCIQGAMVLHDELMDNMTAKVWKEPLEPKYHGSLNLHELLPQDLDFCIFLSSFAGVNGNGGQSNYAAGNTYQASLARHRLQKGLRGITVDLGLILEAGLANSNQFFVQSALRAGFTGVTQDQFLGLLDAVCDQSYDYSQPGAAEVIHVVDSPKQLWEKGDQSTVAWMSKPMFRNLHRLGATYDSSADAAGGNGLRSEDEVDYLSKVCNSASEEEAAEIITRGLIQKLAKSLSLPEADLDPSKPAFRLGVDSLIAVEVRYWFMKQLRVEVSVLNILKDQSLSELCYSVVGEILK